MCDSKSACKGRLIDGGKTMLFLGMINDGNTMLLLPVVGGMIEGREDGASSLGWSMVWLLMCNGKSVCLGGLIDGGNTMFFLGTIDGGNITLLLAGANGLIHGGDTALLLSAGRRFG
jgi:hypothetical protein